MTEQELRDLLERVDQHQLMTEDARSRVRTRLGLEATSRPVVLQPADPVGPIPEPVIDVSLPTHVRPSPPDREPNRLVWMAAAMVVLLAGFAFAIRDAQDGGDVSTVADQAVATAATATAGEELAAGPAYCAGAFAEFVEAIDTWQGLDNWSRVVDGRNPQPHLPTFADTALAELDLVLDDPEVAAERERLTRTIAGLEEAGNSSTYSSYRDEWRQAVEVVVSFVAQTVESDRPPGVDLGECDSGALISAAAGS